jgi:transposase
MEFSSTALQIKLSIRSVTQAFNIDHSVVKRAVLRGYEDPPGRGRHRGLSAEIGQALVEWITKKTYDHKAVNRTELLEICITNLGTAITRGWADSFLSRHADEIFETKSSPQKNQRLEMP